MRIKRTINQGRGNKILVRKNTPGPGMKAIKAIDNPGLEEITLNVLL
jgi:hypothetical protein